MIDEDEPCHCLDNWYGPREDAWVVPTTPDQFCFRSVDVYSFLRLKDGGSGFEGYAKAEFLSVADAALNAARPVRRCTDVSFTVLNGVVVLSSL